MIPTRFIDEPEYERLLNLEPSFVMVHQLDAVDFAPPLPSNGDRDTVTTDHVHILFLNAVEPCIYLDREQGGVPFVILPKHDEIGYDTLGEIHPNKGAWAYRLSPHNWDDRNWQRDSLEYTNWWFKPTPILKYDKENVRSH